MNILAVIPACEGSVVFPNKNMRVIRGKPLIYYAIRNAMASRYVTEVLVTSNSPEILSLARQMGAMTRLRRQELCSTAVSLDAVVWDVFEQVSLADYDYVVTMQPISPTLRAATLDDAFARLLAGGDDTMISVRDMKQFCWLPRDGGAAPLQPERMNRNQLPPLYAETGAFLITRASCIRPDSRIGARTALYELEGDEAIDVNNFGDLKLAENALTRKKTAIFVNGSAAIGLGHITRSLQIADELFTKPDFYYDRAVTDPAAFGATIYSLYPVDGAEGFVRAVSGRGYDLILNDVLDTDVAYMEKLRSATRARIVNFEDSGPGAACADLVINALYEGGDAANTVTGSRYFIIPKLFLIYPPVTVADRVENVMITFGGADPCNYTETLLRIISGPAYENHHFYVVLGSANRRTELTDGRFDRPHITILRNIDNMAEIMSRCDAAVSSRGRTCLELAAMGVPTLSIAQHRREERHTFVQEENGFLCLDAGPDEAEIRRQMDRLLSLTQAERAAMQQRMLAHDLRSGRRRVAQRLMND